jgi:hypothetical protein
MTGEAQRGQENTGGWRGGGQSWPVYGLIPTMLIPTIAHVIYVHIDRH